MKMENEKALVDQMIYSFTKVIAVGVEVGVKRALAEYSGSQPAPVSAQADAPADVPQTKSVTEEKAAKKASPDNKKAAAKSSSKKSAPKSAPKSEESEDVLTIDDVRRIMRDVHINNENGPEKIKAALVSRNAAKISDLSAAEFSSFIEEIRS